MQGKISQCAQEQYHTVQVNVHSDGKRAQQQYHNLHSNSGTMCIVTVGQRANTMCTVTVRQCAEQKYHNVCAQ
jgi:histidyl-tRNA synthetase